MGVWAARVPLKARPGRQRLRSQENSLQTFSGFWARSKLGRLVAGLGAPLAGFAAHFATPLPKQPFHHGVASCFFFCRGASNPFFRGFAAQPPFHHEVVSRFLL